MNDHLRTPQASVVPLLLVDDTPGNLLALEAVLESPEYELAIASSGPAALKLLEQRDFAVALLDVQMPTMDGFETASEMKRLAHRGRPVPIIFVTGIDVAPERVLRAYAEGGVDFIQKPFDAATLRAKIAVFGELYRARQRLVHEQRKAVLALATMGDLALALSEARKTQQVASAVVEQGVRAAQADTCSLYVLDEAAAFLELVGHRGVAPEVLERTRHIAKAASPEMFARLEAGESHWVETPEEYDRVYPELSKMKAAGKRARAFWSVPLIVEGRAVGLLGMGFYEPRAFPPEERALVDTLSKQCAQALLRALRLEREDRTKVRLEKERVRREFLIRAGVTLASSLDYRATLSAIVQFAVPELADWCSIQLVEHGSEDPHQVAVAHVDPKKLRWARELGEKYPPDPNAKTGVPEVIRSGKPELYSEIPGSLLEAAAQNAEHLGFIRELKLESAIVVPLRGRGRVLGAATFIYADSGRRYTTEDLAFAEDFALRAAMAIENAHAIDEAREARAQADHERDRFRRLLDQLPVTVSFLRGDDLVVEYAHPSTVRALGGRELEGKRLLEAVPEHQSQPWVERVREVMRNGEILEQREVLVPLDRGGKLEDTYWTSIYQPLRRRDGSIEGVMTFDQEVTTEKKRTEEKVRLLAIENEVLAEKAQVQEFQERFMAILGHDLRNPLAAIDMGAGVLAQRAERDHDAPTLRVLERMRSSSRRMSRMIEQILDLTRSRLARGLQMDRVDVDLVATLTGVVDELRTAHPARTIHLRCPLKVLGRWDHDRLEQVFSNLVGNAVHYGIAEPVTVDVREDSGVDGPVTVDVHNDGPSIPEDVRATIFAPFRRGERDSRKKWTEGLGLGLYISREIVLAHGGDIEVHSHPAEGTTFRVRLPRRPSDPPGRTLR